MRKIYIFIFVTLIITLSGCGFSSRVILKNVHMFNLFSVEEVFPKTQKVLVRNVDELNEYLATVSVTDSGYIALCNSYDEAYFKNNSLVFINYYEESDNIAVSIGIVGGGGKSLQINVSRDVPDELTENIKYWNIVIELKDTTYPFSNINIHFNIL